MGLTLTDLVAPRVYDAPFLPTRESFLYFITYAGGKAVEKMNQKQIEKINELARKSREFGLTKQEQAEQKRLREQYLADVRRNFRATLDAVTSPVKETH